jgi:hypothetical protein
LRFRVTILPRNQRIHRVCWWCIDCAQYAQSSLQAPDFALMIEQTSMESPLVFADSAGCREQIRIRPNAGQF